MTAWLHLVKKEFRLGLTTFLIPLFAFFLLIAIATFISYQNGFNVWESITIISTITIAFQFFYLVYYLYTSLQAERKTLHLWLHSPMPGYGLLLAKLVAALLSMLITLLITGITFIIAIQQESIFHEPLQFINLTNVAVVGGIHLVLIALSFAVIFLFFWMIYLVISSKFKPFFSFLITLILFILSAGLYGRFSETVLYEKLTHWGQFQLTDFVHSIGIFAGGDVEAEVMSELGQVHLYIGSYIFETVVAVLLFIATCWLLDRKVEV